MFLFTVLVSALTCSGLPTSPSVETGAVGSIRVILAPGLGPIAGSAVRVFARQVSQRCDARVVTTGDAQFVVEMAVDRGVGAEGFRIADRPGGGVLIAAGDGQGLLYGLGKLLRSSRFDRGGFTPGTWRGTSVPVGTVRGIYFASHFSNFYEAAPPEEVERYVEDLALWGINALIVCFPHWQFEGFDDPAARLAIEHLRRIMKSAKAAGMKVGLVETANGGFEHTLPGLRSTPVPDPLGRHGNFGVNLCPDRPEAHATLLENWKRLLEEFSDPGLDYVKLWPYDEGGCGCKVCWPWGARGYPKLCRELAGLTRARFPRAKIILSTWTFDTPPDGEWAGLARSLAADRSWVDYILADAHEDFPRYPLERGVPGGLPLLNFPEISMWGQSPWGGFGANPLPSRLQRLWNQTAGKLSGGFPYSEGIYEDLDKVICAQLYWSPDRPTTETVREYLGFEYSPDAVDDLAAAIGIFEQNHLRDRIGPSADRAFALIKQAEAKLSPRARSAWRWRILYLRGLIDRELYGTRGRLEGDVLRSAFDELTAIYHAEHAHSMPIHPPQIRVTDTRGMALSPSYREAVLASRPVAYWSMDERTGRELHDATGGRHLAVAEEGVQLPTPPSAQGTRSVNSAAGFTGGRIRAPDLPLGDTYSVELWFYNALPTSARPITGYFVSRGPESPAGAPVGDHLGIGGTFLDSGRPTAGRLLFFGSPSSTPSFLGSTTIEPGRWNHIVLVREGTRVRVHLDGNILPEIAGESIVHASAGPRPIFLGGRNDNFANLEGKLDEVAVYDRPLSPQEIARHHAAATGAAAQGEDAGPSSTVRLVVPPGSGAGLERLAAILTRHLADRCGAKVVTSSEAPCVVELAVDSSLAPEAYRITDGPGGGVRITAASERGLLYGLGKFLRTSRFDRGGFTPGTWRGTSAPEKPLRGIYLATHYHNFYHDAPIDEVLRYVEDLGLWGYNTLAVWYDMHHFQGFDDPAGRAFRERLRAILRRAREIGLDVALTTVANEGYGNSPPALRADVSGMRGAKYETDVCTGQAAGRDYVLGNFRQWFDAVADLKPRYVWIWPYDSGGCGCDRCRPWGTNGFPKMAEALAHLARQRLPDVKIVLSTWYMTPDEWRGLGGLLARRPDWADLVLAEDFLGAGRDLPLTTGVPGKLPMVGFPEISMLGIQPWGGFGLVTLPAEFQNRWRQRASALAGGFPYSEGIFEDPSKALFASWYWAPGRLADDILKEYIAFEYSPDVVDDLLGVLHTFERNHRRNAIGADAQAAFDSIRRAGATLTPQAQASWRWRILYLRGLIDTELRRTGGKLEGPQLKRAFEELTRLYHAENALPDWLKPPTAAPRPASRSVPTSIGPGNPR